MRIGFVVERPTQFEAPFFRYAAQDAANELRVFFTGADPSGAVYDPEMGRAVSWGFDLTEGYPHAVIPAHRRAAWLEEELGRVAYDLLIVNGYSRLDYLRAATVARGSGVKTALRLDSVAWDGPNSISWLLCRRILFAGLSRFFDLFLGVGSLTMDYLAGCGIPPRRRGLFPYAVDVDHFHSGSRLLQGEREAARSRLGVATGSRVVLAIAKLNQRESPEDLLWALPHLQGDVHALIAGDGPERGHLEEIAAKSAAGRIRFLGYVPYADLPTLYAASDAFVHAAREERWGVSVAEALACDLPVVASSRVGAGVDLIRAGENGWTYMRGNTSQLAERLSGALALDRDAVARTNRAVLSRWDYAATWSYLLDAARRSAGDQ